MLNLKNKDEILKVVGSLGIHYGSSALQVLRRFLIWPVDCIRSLYRPRFRYPIQHPSRILCDGRMHRWQARPLFNFIFIIHDFSHMPYRSPVLLYSPDKTPLPISWSVPYRIGACDILRTFPTPAPDRTPTD